METNHTERVYLLGLLHETQEQYQQILSGVNSVQAQFKMSEQSWSILEIAEHIAVVEQRIFSQLLQQLESPSDPGRRQEIRVSDQQIMLILGQRRGRAQSPEAALPKGRYRDLASALEAFQAQRRVIEEFVNNNRANLRERYWTHFATGLIDLYQTLILICAHTKRHLQQIEAIKLNEQ